MCLEYLTIKMDTTTQNELLDTLIRERRIQLWNSIQKLYSIPENTKTSIYNWIIHDCNYIPRITKVPIEPVVPHVNT
jgi:hypothetical protein